MHIAIAGNIGSGKTTLTKMLAKHYNWSPLFEPVDFNPYLEDFYQDMNRWSFNLQIYFLNKRFKDVVAIGRSSDTIIQDRTIFEDARIFAPNLHKMGMMSDRDFQNYTDLFDLMMSLVKLPDLMIYIKSSIPTLVSHIEKRGRDFEKTMSIGLPPTRGASSWWKAMNSSLKATPRTSVKSPNALTANSSASFRPNLDVARVPLYRIAVFPRSICSCFSSCKCCVVLSIKTSQHQPLSTPLHTYASSASFLVRRHSIAQAVHLSLPLHAPSALSGRGRCRAHLSAHSASLAG